MDMFAIVYTEQRTDVENSLSRWRGTVAVSRTSIARTKGGRSQMSPPFQALKLCPEVIAGPDGSMIAEVSRQVRDGEPRPTVEPCHWMFMTYIVAPKFCMAHRHVAKWTDQTQRR
jgi:nucleotidyltransferase/DNA polymerase involved in DNA repair